MPYEQALELLELTSLAPTATLPRLVAQHSRLQGTVMQPNSRPNQRSGGRFGSGVKSSYGTHCMHVLVVMTAGSFVIDFNFRNVCMATTGDSSIRAERDP